MSLPELRLERGRPVEIPELVRSEDGAPAKLPTRVELLDTGDRLDLRFHCVDPDPWATLGDRDDPLWTEEVVELFLAPGGDTPHRYFEFEINPIGTLFDARVDSPHGDRREMSVDIAWSCPEIRYDARIGDAGWTARISLPWRELVGGNDSRVWRANLFRIDRPRGADPEHTAWSPTGISPADFHRPARFGILRRVG